MAAAGSVRRRVRAAIVGTAALALVLLGLPLAWTVAGLYRGQAEARLDGEAARLLAAVPDERLVRGLVVPVPLDPRTTLGLYDGHGDRIAGDGPPHDPLVRVAARRLTAVHGRSGSSLAVAEPFRRDEGDTVVVRAAEPYSRVLNRTWSAWGLQAALTVGILVLAWVLAARRAATLARPLERLTADAQALGHGDFAVPQRTTGVLEADAASAALVETGRRLRALLERERAFSADASHQLRTPLTGLRLGVESALLDPDADHEQALRDVERRLDGLESTVTALLSLARDTSAVGGTCDVTAVAQAVVSDFVSRHRASAARPLRLTVTPGVPEAACDPHALTQVLSVLVDNALVHGKGAVDVRVREAGTGVAVDVRDQGEGLGPDPERCFVRRSPHARGHGIGLALARSLAEAEGGRLVVGSPGSVLTVLLPAAP